jgi:serine/threonine protein kinase
VRRLRSGAPRELAPGDRLGAYVLDELLGEGGVGLVFKAHRDEDGTVVALKILRQDLTSDDVFRRRFAQEARAAAAIQSPHLVSIVEAGEIEGRHFIAAPFAECGTLEQRLAKRGPLDIGETLRLVDDVAAGLDALHEAGLVHRDVKSSNVVFDGEGTALLTDLGLAKAGTDPALTRPGQMLGTPHYLAPEVIRGQPATPASDVYAFGCTVFECLTGSTPFADRTLFMVALAHVEDPPASPADARPELGTAGAEAVLAALEKEPERRPPSAGAYAAMLRSAIEKPVSPEPTSRPTTPRGASPTPG